MKPNVEEKTMREIQTMVPDLQSSVEKLGIVLEELVEMLAYDGSGVDIFLPQYVAEARGKVRYIIELLGGEGNKQKIVG